MKAEEHSAGQKRQHSCRGKRNVLFYAMVSFAVCWLQLSANIFVFFWRNKDSLGSTTGRFPLQPRPFLKKNEAEKTIDGNLRSRRSMVSRDNDKISPSLPSQEQHISVSSLEAQLFDLSKRLERVQMSRQKEQDASTFLSENRKVFVPFTIRDAQRTVPTQIPHGFEIFDFIDLYATNGDQNQTARIEDKTKKTETDDITDSFPSPDTSTIGLYLNGKPLSVEDGIDIECLGYSKKCYRSKFLLVVRYLLSLQNSYEQNPENSNRLGDEKNVEYYYFYMEADNDLCVPINEIRGLAFQHQRYFISTGTGASGWIMSHQFLKDFHSFWNSFNETNSQGLSGEQILEPDLVAGRLLQEKLAWSVTRRYLTSHSILTGTTSDAHSIGALFKRVDPVIPMDKAATNPEQTKSKLLKKKETPEEAAKKAPLMEPSRYLPRCLEPHRGVWKKESKEDDTETENHFDVHHWGFFDYNLCPDSDIFPCAEGQLEGLAKKDPYFETIRKKKKSVLE